MTHRIILMKPDCVFLICPRKSGFIDILGTTLAPRSGLFSGKVFVLGQSVLYQKFVRGSFQIRVNVHQSKTVELSMGLKAYSNCDIAMHSATKIGQICAQSRPIGEFDIHSSSSVCVHSFKVLDDVSDYACTVVDILP